MVIKDFTVRFNKSKDCSHILVSLHAGKQYDYRFGCVGVLNAIDQCSDNRAVCIMLAETLAHSPYAVF